jgi:hypothetical protein
MKNVKPVMLKKKAESKSEFTARGKDKRTSSVQKKLIPVFS